MTQPALFATRTRTQLDLSVPASAWEGVFDQLEVWRSRTGPSGPYEALHSSTWRPATLPAGFSGQAGGSGPTAMLVGKKIKFLVNELIPLEWTFIGVDPLTFAQAATQINNIPGGLLSSFVSGVTLVVSTVQPGLLALLRCTGGDAAPLLNLSTTAPVSFGLDARIMLVHGQEQYAFIDPDGSQDTWYKYRLYNSASLLTGDFTAPFQPSAATRLSASNLVRCYVDLVDMSGLAAAGVEVYVSCPFYGYRIENKTMVGGNALFHTDRDGHMEVQLPRGSQVVVALGGTALSRAFTVPVDQAIQSVDMLDPSVGSGDLFSVQVPNLPFAARRTL